MIITSPEDTAGGRFCKVLIVAEFPARYNFRSVALFKLKLFINS